MPSEPTHKRAIAFVDGQNLFHAAREAFGSRFPDYDPLGLQKQSARHAPGLAKRVQFYTGVPDAADDPFWNHFWTAKLSAMGRRGVVKVFSRPLRYRNQTVRLPGGGTHTFLSHRKRASISAWPWMSSLPPAPVCAMSPWSSARTRIFPRSRTKSECIAREHDRWFKIASAYPCSPTSRNRRGINSTDWIRIDRALYNACLDPSEYRKPSGP